MMIRTLGAEAPSAEFLVEERPIVPSRIGPYLILRKLGSGGMGTVYAARDTRLGRDVAIKILRGALSPEEVMRFQREAQLTSHLRHPRIVALYDVGTHDGFPYLVMPLIEGESLAERRLQRRAAVALLASIADAVDYAHERGVVHCDLKPENIVLDAEGRGTIADFGLALDLHTGSSPASPGFIFGTPAFMSPEQARGETHRVDRRTDVWGLGATLYFALTHRLPFAGATATEVIREILERNPPTLRSHDPRIHPEIDRICMKALEKEPRRRYATAREFADDLRRFLVGDPVAARPTPRRRLLAAATVAIFELLAGALWVAHLIA